MGSRWVLRWALVPSVQTHFTVYAISSSLKVSRVTWGQTPCGLGLSVETSLQQYCGAYDRLQLGLLKLSSSCFKLSLYFSIHM